MPGIKIYYLSDNLYLDKLPQLSERNRFVLQKLFKRELFSLTQDVIRHCILSATCLKKYGGGILIAFRFA